MQKLWIVITVVVMILGISTYAFSTFQATKQADFLAEMSSICNEMDSVRSRALALNRAWFSNGFNTGDTAIGDQTSGEYEGITFVQIEAVMTSLGGFDSWINVGHDDNLAKMQRRTTRSWR